MKRNSYLIRRKLVETMMKEDLSIDEFRELFVQLYSKIKSYTVSDEEMAMRFFELAKPFYSYITVECSLCNDTARVGSSKYVDGMVLGGFNMKWICPTCKVDLQQEMEF